METERMRRLLYVGCLGYGNAGDEACWEGFEVAMRPHLWRDWEIAAKDGYRFTGDEEFDALVVGGGTLLSPHGNLCDTAMRTAKERGVPYTLFATGLESREWEGSVPESGVRSLLEHVEGASRIGVRGPGSKRYLTQLGVAEESVQVIGDLALCLDAAPPTTGELLPTDVPWIGINVGTSFGKIFGFDEKHALDMVVRAAELWLTQGFGVCFYPVWESDLAVQQQAVDRLSGTVRSIGEVLSPRELIRLSKEFHAILAMKLHAGIFAAIAGTPYVPLAYRPKVEDFAESVGLISYSVRTDAASQDLSSSMHRLIGDRDALSDALDSSVRIWRRELDQFAEQLARDLRQPVLR